MKVFFKWAGIVVLSIFVLFYLCFLFVVPNVIDLNKYCPLLKDIVKEQAGLNIDIVNPKVVTTPIFEIGVKTDGIKISLPNGENVLNSDRFKVKLFLPSIPLLTVKISCLELDNLKIKLDTNAEGNQYKLISVIENSLNANLNKVDTEEKIDETENGFFDPEWIKIKVPNAVITNYNVNVKDLKTNHGLTLKGEELKLGYFHNRGAKLKTYAYLMSDDKTNITANLNIKTFLPKHVKKVLDEDDDRAQKIEIPYVNIIKIYQNYDLQTHINSKLRIKKSKDETIHIKGFFNVDDFTLKLAKYNLPKCYFHSKFRNNIANIDTNLYVTPYEHINIFGKLNYNKPAFDLAFSGDKVYFNDLIIFSKAVLDSFGIRNDLSNLQGRGYVLANAKIKTNFKKLKSEGKIIIRDGSAINNKIGLVVTGTNSDLLFDNNIFKIDNTCIYVSGKPLIINGTIDNKAIANLYINTKNLPITGLYRAIAPSGIKEKINMSSGNVSIDAKINGKLKKSLSSLRFDLSDLGISTVDNSLTLKNGNLNLTVMYDLAENILKGNITNKNLLLTLPSTKSVIKDNLLSVDFNNDNITINPTNLLINSNSSIKINGTVADYKVNPAINIFGVGNLLAVDLKNFAGDAAAPYISAKGSLPIKFKLTGNDKKQYIISQLYSSGNNFITPVYFKSLRGKNCLTQLKIHYKGDRLNVQDTGLFVTNKPFSNDFASNMSGSTPVMRLHGTIAKLDTIAPRINLLKLDIPNDLDGTIFALKRSRFNLNGGAVIFGRISNPVIYGGINIDKIDVPSLLTKVESSGVKFNGHSMELFADKINLNGSDMNVSAHSNFEFSPVTKLFKLDVTSNDFNLDKVLKVADAASKTLPSAGNSSASSSSQADIPLDVRGRFSFKKIRTGNIVLNNTRGRLILNKSIVYIRPFVTDIFKGKVNGQISTNLLNGAIAMDIKGDGIDTEQALFDAANTKDAISGTTAFNMKAELKGSSYEEQMKSLKGKVNFSIKDGGFGPIGKIENLILAENIRESQFFQTALGGILKNIATIDTAHFSELKGKIIFKDGKAILSPITSQGNVMCLHISGDYDLLKNEADMKVRGRLGSFISNMLGPISALNPINLVKATPGINVVMAKAFSLFTVSVTQAEMDAIPAFGKSQDDLSATKFQIVLRGDATKPLSMIKSFKWLALQSDIDKASNFTENLPEEYLLADPTTPEAQAAAAAKAKEDAKLINRVKRKFRKE